MKKSRLLLVEDDQEMCEELVPILEGNDYLVDVVHDGQSAIAFLEKDGYGLLLLDLKMPGINGYEVLKYARTMRLPVKIIVLSGSPLHKTKVKDEEQVFPSGMNYEQVIQQTADGYIGKPFEVETVLLKIKEVLGRP